MIIARKCTGAAASNLASSSSVIRRRRWLSSCRRLMSVSLPRRNGVRSTYSRATAQFIMWRSSSTVRFTDAAVIERGAASRPTMRGLRRSATKSSTSAVLMLASARSPKRSSSGRSRQSIVRASDSPFATA